MSSTGATTMKGGTARNVGLVGPSGAGKSTLLASLQAAAGGSVQRGTPETRGVGTELHLGTLEQDGLAFTFLDCPGSSEFCYETRAALAGLDLAVVVVEPVLERLVTAAPILHHLDALSIPHLIFINKMDRSETPYRDLLAGLGRLSTRPVIPHFYAIGRGETLEGTIDLVTEEAFAFKEGAPAEPVPLPEAYRDREQAARAMMLETLADHDDELMAQIVMDETPDKGRIFADLCRTLAEDSVVPVLCGAALASKGVRRLLAILSAATPAPSGRARQLGFAEDGPPIVQILKNWHVPHQGKTSLARIWQGRLAEGDQLDGMRVTAIFRPGEAEKPEQVGAAEAGAIVLLGRLEEAGTGALLSTQPLPADILASPPTLPAPMLKQGIQASSRQDEVKLSAALARLTDEDPSLRVEHDAESGQILLLSQGELHLKTAVEKLRQRFNLSIETTTPRTAYRETIRAAGNAHGRHKKQSGGHGQFGDVKIEIQPCARGAGFSFTSRVVGGSVPKQYVPAVEAGAKESLARGPLGYPVVDVAITLTDGQYHSVDSNELSFKMATGLALKEGLKQCQPVLLEPVERIVLFVPTDCTARTLQLISARRGQILSYAAKPGWPGWDQIEAHLPASEETDLASTLRSLTQGVGFFESSFDHLEEVPERLTQTILAATPA